MKKATTGSKNRAVSASRESTRGAVRPTTKIPNAVALGILGFCLAAGVGAVAALTSPQGPALSTAGPLDAVVASTDESPRVVAWKQFVGQHFAGDASCAGCHPKQAAAQQRSGHSQTMIPMRDSGFAAQLAADVLYPDPRRPQTFEFAMNEHQFVVRDADDPGLPALPVTWLLGSGAHAQTPVFVDSKTQRGVELRWSYLASDDAIGLTPEHERFDRYEGQTQQCYGRPLDTSDVRSCLGCHSTIGPPANLPIHADLYVANVGCERCHGPRKEHVLLAQQGRGDESKPLVQYESADAYIDACAQCHRDESSVAPDALPHELVRFQPVGLKRSRCYTQSAEKLTCSTCHDPHDTVSHDRNVYIEQCTQCHQPQRDPLCSASPHGDCIECHMPVTQWTSGISFHDHEIRIVKPRDPKISNAQVNR